MAQQGEKPGDIVTLIEYARIQKSKRDPADHLEGCPRRQSSAHLFDLVQTQTNESSGLCVLTVWEQVAKEEFPSRFPVFADNIGLSQESRNLLQSRLYCLYLVLYNGNRLNLDYVFRPSDPAFATAFPHLWGSKASADLDHDNPEEAILNANRDDPDSMAMRELVTKLHACLYRTAPGLASTPMHRLGLRLFTMDVMPPCNCAFIKFKVPSIEFQPRIVAKKAGTTAGK